MIEGSGLAVFLKYIMAPFSALAAVVWWFFKRNELATDSKIQKQSTRTDNIERRLAHLEKTEAEMRARLEYIAESMRDHKRLLEKMDDKLDNYYGQKK